MKKRTPSKKKSAAKPRAAKKSPPKARKPAARAAAAPAPRAAAAPAPRVQAYTPQPLKTDGWAPFRYPLQ
jgi:hypothetical protein